MSTLTLHVDVFSDWMPLDLGFRLSQVAILALQSALKVHESEIVSKEHVAKGLPGLRPVPGKANTRTCLLNACAQQWFSRSAVAHMPVGCVQGLRMGRLFKPLD